MEEHKTSLEIIKRTIAIAANVEDLTPNVLNWLMSVIIQFEPRHQCCHQLLLLTLQGNISAGFVSEVNEQWKDPTRKPQTTEEMYLISNETIVRIAVNYPSILSNVARR